jgi:hypothetical protein
MVQEGVDVVEDFFFGYGVVGVVVLELFLCLVFEVGERVYHTYFCPTAPNFF